jgi:hypothetical protein
MVIVLLSILQLMEVIPTEGVIEIALVKEVMSIVFENSITILSVIFIVPLSAGTVEVTAGAKDGTKSVITEFEISDSFQKRFKVVAK